MDIKWHKRLAIVAAVIACCIVSGCGTQARRVDCEWGLKPINVQEPQ